MAGRPIDEKIVVMKLDNSDFKQKAMETTGLFGKLKDSLNKIPGVNLGKTVNDLNGIKSAAAGTNLGPLSTSIQGVSSKFSAMSVIATTALATIVNQAVNAGTGLAKALSLDQVTAGFQEYELKMGSIQTILANTSKHGTTLKDVTRNFEELNAYADKTIYSFGDMTKNIGLFTNAGLKLDESTSMIKGFSNAAAASGTNSTAAAGAAYQLSQGLSAGYIMTMDWMSLTNAGMGNDNMKNDLIALGQEMGTLDRTTEDTLKNWKEALSDDKWLTSDVMSKYLQTMAGDVSKAELMTIGLSEAQADLMLSNAQMGEDAATKVRTFTQLMDTLKESIGSGWATSFELVLGDFNEATELFSGISDKLGAAVGKSNEARNKFFEGVAKGNGFKNIFEGIVSAATPVAQVFNAMSAGFKKVFPPASVATVIKLTESFKEFAAGLALSKDRIAQVTTIFQGVFSIFSSVWEIAKRLGKAFVQLIPEGAGGGVLALAEKLALLAIGFNQSLKEGNMLTGFIDGMGKGFGMIGDLLGGVGSSVIEFAGSLRENLGKAIDWVIEKLAPVGAYFKEAFGGSYGDEALGAGTLVAIFAIVKKIKEYFEGDFDIFGSLSDMVDGISETFSGIGEAVNNFATSIKYVNLILIATAIGILAASLKILEGIKAEDISKGITALATTLGLMIAGMLIMSKFNVTGGLGAAVTLIGLSVAVNLMAVALKKISDLDTKALVKGISGLAAIVATLSIALIAISKFGGKIQVGSLQLIALAGAVVILASAIETMSAIKTGDLFKSVGALALIFGSLAIFLKIVDRTKFGMGSAVGLVLVAAAVKVMVTAIEDMSDINTENMIKGLLSITAILGAMALFSKVASGPQMLIAGAGMLVIAEALKRLVEPITTFSEMSWQELGKGMAGLAASLLILAGGIAIFTLAAGGPMVLVAASGMLLMAKAMQMLVGPITTLSGMTWEELGKGMAGMAAALLILAGAAALMTAGIAGSLGVIAMAYALQLLVPSVKFFSELSWMEMLKGFTGLALAFALLAGAALLLTPAVPSMLAFGLALGLIGVGMLAAGAGMMLFGTGMTALATLTTVSVTAIVSSLSLLIQGLGGLILEIVDFVVKLGMALLDGLNQLLPKLAEVAWNIVQTILTGLEANMPMIVEKGSNILISLIDGMATKLPEIMASITNLMEQLAVAVETNSGPFLNAWLSIMTEVAVVMVRSGAAVIDALFGWIPGVGEVTSQIGDTAELNIREAFDAQKVATDKGTEFANGLSGTTGLAGEAGTLVAGSSSAAIMASSLNPAGKYLGLDFSGGVTSTSGVANAAGSILATNTETGASVLNLDPIGLAGGSGFASAISSTSGAANSSGTVIANSAKSGADILNLNPIGNRGGTGFASSIGATSGAAQGAGTTIANSAKGGANVLNLTPIGTRGGTGFASSISATSGKSRTSGTTIANSAKSGASSVDVSSVGTNFGEGFAKGISGMRDRVVSAARGIAAAASATMRYVLDTHSPSKVTTKIGEDTGQGFANGISNKKKKAEEAAAKIAEAAKKKFENSKDWISNRKYYNDLSAQEELAAWTRVSVRYKKGTAERKEADKEIYRLKNDINKKLIDMNKEYTDKVLASNQKLIADEKALNDEYESTLKSKTDSLKSFAGLFDKVNDESDVSGAQLTENLKGQVETFTDWKNNLQALSSRPVYAGLLEELTEMGPKAAKEIEALNSMTNEQLQEYSELWGQKNQLASNEAERELKGMKESTVNEIKELRKASAKELTTYKNEWLASIKEIRYGTPKEFVGLNTSLQTIGVNAIQGMVKGMNSMSGPLANEAKALANSIAKTIKTTLKIKSPSRVAEGLGSFFGEGLANGIANQSKAVLESSKQLAITAKDSLNKFLEGFDPSPEDNEIHFKAVVDYDGFTPGVGKIPVGMIPDTSFTSGMVTATKASLSRQNGNISPRESVTNSTSNEYKYDIHVTANGTMSRTEVRKLAVQIRDEIKNEDDRGRISKGREVAF